MTPTTTPSTTGTPPQNYFRNNTVLLLRAGSGGNVGAPGVSLPVFWDEVGVAGLTAGAVLQTLSIPDCTLSYGVASDGSWLYSQEGVPKLSNDGLVAVFPCYTTPAGGNLAATDAKTVAMLSYDGSVDVSTKNIWWRQWAFCRLAERYVAAGVAHGAH